MKALLYESSECFAVGDVNEPSINVNQVLEA